jgi:hypothetical protein
VTASHRLVHCCCLVLTGTDIGTNIQSGLSCKGCNMVQLPNVWQPLQCLDSQLPAMPAEMACI